MKGAMAGAIAALGKGAAAPRLPHPPQGAPPPPAGKGAVIKRPLPAGGLPPQKIQRRQASIVVYTTAEKDDIGMRTLVGEYQEEGMNHERKYYKNIQKIPGHEDVDVYLYFWDERDGPSFKGWWFGNQVGGAQVWSRNTNASTTPPKAGWTIPWDGPVKNELVVSMNTEQVQQTSSKVAELKQAASQAEARKAQEGAKYSQAIAQEWEDRVQQATEKAAEVEINIGEALELAKQALDNDDDSAVLEAQKELAAQASAAAEVQRTIAREGLAAQKAPPDLKAELVALGTRLRTMQATIKEEITNLKNSKFTKMQRAEEAQMREAEDARMQELEGLHSQQLEEMLPAAMEKTDKAEDEVEKVTIASAPLQVEAGDDLRPVMMQAIKDTEQRVRVAQAAIGEARRFISGKLTLVGRFAPSIKKTAVDEFTGLQDKLNEAQNKLNPFKTVRQDYEQRLQAKKLQEELNSKLAGAEVEVEKAAMMVAPLGGDNQEGMKETEMALGTAQSTLSQVSRLIETKLKNVEKTPGPLRDEIKGLHDRCKQAQEKLDEVRKSVKETQVRIAADNLLREVSEKVNDVEDELQVMAEAELPFLRGEQHGKDLDTLIADAEKIATKVHTALTEAQSLVAKRMIEVARFTEGPAKSVKEEIDMLQKRMEDGRERLQQFRASTAERKRTHLLEDVDTKVTAAEAEVQKMAQATQALNSIGLPGEAAAEGAQDVVEQASLVERAAQASIVAARKHLLLRTTELKKLAMAGAHSGSELGRLQTRVNSMQQDMTKLRTTTKDAEERLRVKQLNAELAMRVHVSEAEVDKVAAAVAPKGDEAVSAETVERLDKVMSSATTKISATSTLLDVKLKTASGILKEELSAMRAKVTRAEKKLAKVTATAKEQRERLESAELISSAMERVQKAEGALQRYSEAELPFLKGLESLATGEAMKALTACEAAALEAQKAITEARTFIVQKLLDAKSFTDGVADACTKELLQHQKKLDASAGKLTELKKDTAQRRHKAQMQASSEKVTKVEESVQALANTVSKFSDDKMDKMTPEEAVAMCEEIAQSEADAQTAVTDARKYLAMRMQDVKSSTEAQRGPMMAELARLQGRLTQCQVELAKLSKQCTEREQRYVAQALVQNAGSTLASLQQDLESANKVAAPLLEEDRTAFLKASRFDTVTAALHAYRKSSGKKVAEIFADITTGPSASRADTVAFLKKLPELAAKEDAAAFTAEQWDEVLSAVAGKAAQVTAAILEQWLRPRMICVANASLSDAADGGKAAGSLHVGEGVEVLEQVVAKDGSKMAKCLLARDGSSVWVTVQSLRPSPPFAGCLESIEAYVNGAFAKCAEVGRQMDQKAVEVASAKQGPLSEVRPKLLQIRTQLTHDQAKADTLKKRTTAAKLAVLQARKDQLAKMQEAQCKAFAEKSVKECTDAVVAAEAVVAQAAEKSKVDEKAADIGLLAAAKRYTDDAQRSLADAKAVVARNMASHEAFKGASRSLLLEARVELTKLNARVQGAERKLALTTEAVGKAYAQVAKVATTQAKRALRDAARKSGKSVDDLFMQVSQGATEITEAQFINFVKTLPGQDLSKEQVALVYREFGPQGLYKSGFAKALQEFCTCQREIAITDVFDIEGSNMVRKLESGELFEVLEGPVEDEKSQVKRVRGRAVRDGTVGWVTVKGNQGTPFLKPRDKPFLVATREAAMHAEFNSSSPVVRDLVKEEALELLEGPRDEAVDTEMLLRARASSDGSEGYLVLRDAAGAASAELSTSLFVCRSTIAMTDVFNIEECKVVRKVEVGEALEVVGGKDEKGDDDKAIKRLQFRAVRDGKEGWVTLKGNQGTVYVEKSTSHYVVSREAVLREGTLRTSAALRPLKVGEAVEALDAPVEVKPDARMGVLVRAQDGKSGWVVFEKGPNAPVMPQKKAPTAPTA